MMRTKNQRVLVVLLVIITLFAATCSAVFGNDQLDWGVERIRSYCVWDNDNWNMTNWNTTTWDIDVGANAGQNATVAIIDTGIYYTTNISGTFIHPELAANVKGMAGFFYNISTHVVDRHTDTVNDAYYINDSLWGHGTGIAGVIASAINGIGLIGTAPNVSIYSLKVNSLGWDHDLAEEIATAINYSIDTLHVNVISISIGVSGNWQDLNNSCIYAFNNDALLIAAAGDLNTTDLGYPASYFPYVVPVGSTDQNDTRAVFGWPLIASNYGPLLQFMAPGVDINTTTIGGYSRANGTSYSAPFVSATAALIFASKMDLNFDSPPYNHQWDNTEVWTKMVLNGTLRLGGTRFKDNYTGWGLVNAWLANQRPLGDINCDNKTDGKDVAWASLAYGTVPRDPRWDPRADVDINKKVDGKDIAIIAGNFGAGDP
jgi:hypothetical protein